MRRMETLVPVNDNGPSASWRNEVRKQSSMIRKSSIARFEMLTATDKQYQETDPTLQRLYGPFKHLKNQLDHDSYHVFYRKERQWYHDSIIEDILDSIEEEQEEGNMCITPTEPWLLYGVGVPGVGVHHVIRTLYQQGRLPLLSFVFVDRDELQKRLPEYEMYTSNGLDTDAICELTDKECGYLMELLVLAAIQAGRNVIISGYALADSSWHVEWISRMKTRYKSLKVGMIHVTAPIKQIEKRTKKRANETGTELDFDYIEHLQQELPNRVQEFQAQCKEHLEFFCHLENIQVDAPDLISGWHRNVTDKLDWVGFQHAFLQTCAWMPGMSKDKNKVPKKHISVVEDEKVGPNKQSLQEEQQQDVITELPTLKRNASHGDAAFQPLGSPSSSAMPSKPSGPLGKVKRALSSDPTKAHQKLIKRSSLICRRRRRFSVLISSEENNQNPDTSAFYGKYSHIRETLDYNYHSNYTFERQKYQDAIITDLLDAAVLTDNHNGKLGTTPTEPWIVFTAGAMGAGKSYTMNKLVERQRFPLKAFVVVDPDEIRRLLPEFHIYVQDNAELAGELTRKEAGYIAEILTLAALQAGKNVLQDGSLRDSDWYKIYFQRLRTEFPNVRQAILHVTAPKEAVFQRAEERAQTTGRVVPRHILEAALEQVPKSVKTLSPLVDYYAELLNAPGANDIKLVVPNNDDWKSFEQTWRQTLAYVPHRTKFLDKAKRVENKLGRDGTVK